ncbi:hypothetical protein Q7P37_010329 [Cladosporium fusiforme]
MVTTRAMARCLLHVPGNLQRSRKRSAPTDTSTGGSTTARLSKQQRSTAREIANGGLAIDKSYGTVLPRTRIVVGRYEVLQDVVVDRCKRYIEDLVDFLLGIDGQEEHDAVNGLLTAFPMLKAEVYGTFGKVSRIIPVAKNHVLPLLEDIKKIHSTRSKASETTLFFRNLIEDVEAHYHNSSKTRKRDTRTVLVLADEEDVLDAVVDDVFGFLERVLPPVVAAGREEHAALGWPFASRQAAGFQSALYEIGYNPVMNDYPWASDMIRVRKGDFPTLDSVQGVHQILMRNTLQD